MPACKPIFCVLVFAVLVLVACKKENNNSPDQLLIAIEYHNTDGSVGGRTDFIHDQNGRLVQIFSGNILLLANYNGNEITILKSYYSVGGLDDTVRLFLDGNQRILKRLEHFHDNGLNSGYEEEIWDTASYRYDLFGFLVNESHAGKRYGSSATDAYGTTTTNLTIDYTNSNGNLARKHTVSNSTTIYDTGWPSTSAHFESTSEYQYLSASPNKTEFSSSPVLNEWWQFVPTGLFDKHFRNFPDRIDGSAVSTSSDDNTSYFSQSTIGFTFKYNADGLLTSVSNSTYPNGSTVFIYGK